MLTGPADPLHVPQGVATRAVSVWLDTLASTHSEYDPLVVLVASPVVSVMVAASPEGMGLTRPLIVALDAVTAMLTPVTEAPGDTANGPYDPVNPPHGPGTVAVSVWFVVVPPAATHIVNMPDPDPGTLTESPDRSLTVAADELGMPVTVPLTVAWLPMLHVDAASGNGWYAAARRAMPEKAGTEARLLLPLTV